MQPMPEIRESIKLVDDQLMDLHENIIVEEDQIHDNNIVSSSISFPDASISTNVDVDEQGGLNLCVSLPFLQKVLYIIICYDNVSLVAIALTWGFTVMVMIYAVGHISGAHFNPAVTIAFATCKTFPWKQMTFGHVGAGLCCCSSGGIDHGKWEPYVSVQWGKELKDHFVGTVPSGSDLQSLSLEFITTFYLMFVIYALSTDNRSHKVNSGLAIGATVSSNILFAGPISGASMNPARSLGPAIVWSRSKGLWIYMVGPTIGAIAGAWVYHFLKLSNRSLCFTIVDKRLQTSWKAKCK